MERLEQPTLNIGMFSEVASLTTVKKSQKVGPQLGTFWAFSLCVQIQPGHNGYVE